MKALAAHSYNAMSFFGGLVFFAPAALLVRTRAGISQGQFFLLQALLSGAIALGEIPSGRIADRLGCKRALVLSQALLLSAYLTRSFALFALEAVVEGLSACLASGRTAPICIPAMGKVSTCPARPGRPTGARRRLS